MGHLVVNSGIRCQVILVKRGLAGREESLGVDVRRIDGAVVTISKVLDLVGIPSILVHSRVTLDESNALLLDRRQPIARLRHQFPVTDGVAVQTVPHASKLARRHAGFAPAVVAAIWVLLFASVVLLE